MIKRPRLAQKIKEELPDENIDVTCPIKSEDSSVLKCELCDTICVSISQLQSHTLSQHVPSKQIENPTGSSQHQKLSCQQCDSTFDSFSQFASHMKSHLTNSSSSQNSSSSSPSSPPTTNNIILYCPLCPLMTFLDTNSRLEHITLQHLQMRVTQYMCSHCDISFISPQIFNTHFNQCHLRIKYECKVCNYVTDNEKIFKDHSRSHSRQEISLGCMACACTFSNQQMLMAHVQLCHSHDSNLFKNRLILPGNPKLPETTPRASKQSTRPLTCSVCDETVIGEDGLDEHRLFRHCKVRYADKCADCHEQITNDEEFVEHCAKHAKDMTIHCPVCRQTLRSEIQIHAHKNYHMESRPPSIEKQEEFEQNDDNNFNFTCPVCGEKFKNALKLIDHGFTHSVQ